MFFLYHKKNDSTLTMRIVCAIVFIVFSYTYLYYFQMDMLAVAQHIWSGGHTHYNRLIGAVLITIVLQLVQYGVYLVTKLHKRSHALTYIPSFLFLMVLTDISPDIGKDTGTSCWWWLLPLLLLIWGFAVWAAKQFEPYEPEMNHRGLFSRLYWMNIVQILVMFFIVALVCSGHDTFRYRMRVEDHLINNDYQGALSIGKLSQKTDSSLTMLRIYALSRQGQLGENLFDYPLTGGSMSLLPNGVSVKCMMYPTDSIYKYFGAKPKESLAPMTYLKLMEKRKIVSRQLYDYILCGYLLDRNIDAFAKNVGKYYKLDVKLPKYYREALVLYTHLRANPVIVFHDNIMDADFQDMQDIAKKTSDKLLRKEQVKETYSDTYWYYYMYNK